MTNTVERIPVRRDASDIVRKFIETGWIYVDWCSIFFFVYWCRFVLTHNMAKSPYKYNDIKLLFVSHSSYWNLYNFRFFFFFLLNTHLRFNRFVIFIDNRKYIEMFNQLHRKEVWTWSISLSWAASYYNIRINTSGLRIIHIIPTWL